MDREAIGRELESLYAPLRKFAAVVGPPDAEPDDIVQEALVRALRRGVAEIDDLPSYLRRVIVNISSTSRRSFVRHQRAMTRLGPSTHFVDIESPLLTDVMRLPAEQRAVLWMSEVEGWPFAEIARVLGCTEEAARTRASRARQRLRLELAKETER